MNPQELFSTMEILLQRLKEYQKSSVLTFKDQNELESIRQVYKHIMPGAEVTTSCTSCVLHYLNMMLSYYEREHPRWVKTQEDGIAYLTEEDMARAPKPKPAKKKPTRAEILEKARAARKQ